MTETISPAAAIIESLEELPPFPPVLAEILQILHDKDASADDLARLIEKDQALTAKLLRLTNSAYYGFSKRIGNITTAVVLLGFNAVKQLVLGVSFLDYFRRKKSPVLSAAELWRHSYTSALCARAISIKTKSDNFETDFVIALVHDVGKLIISWHFGQRVPKEMDLVRSGGVQGLMEERRVFGADHAELGAELARAWQFPDVLVDVIRLHETPFLSQVTDQKYLQQLLVVHLADQIAWPHQLSTGARLSQAPFIDSVVEKLGVSQGDLIRIAADSATRSATVLEALGE